MIRYILSFALLLSSFGASAQYFGYGVGLNLGHALLQETNVLPSTRVAVHFPIAIDKKTMLDLSVKYDQYGYVDLKILDSYESINHKLGALSASVIYQSFIGGKRAKTRPYVGAGAKLGYIVSATSEFYADSSNSSGVDYVYNFAATEKTWEDMNRIRFGVVMDAGISFKLGKKAMLLTGITYDLEITDIFNEASGIAASDNSGLGIISIGSRIIYRL